MRSDCWLGHTLIEMVFVLLGSSLLVLAGMELLSKIQRQDMHWRGVLESQYQEILIQSVLSREFLKQGLDAFGEGVHHPINIASDPLGVVSMGLQKSFHVFHPAQLPSLIRLGLDSPGNGRLAKDSDVILVLSLSPENTWLTRLATAGESTLWVTPQAIVERGDVLLINSGEQFIAASVKSSRRQSMGCQIELTQPLPVSMGLGSWVEQLVWRIFYLGEVNIKGRDQPLYGLYVMDMKRRRQELFSRLKSFQVSEEGVGHQVLRLRIGLENKHWVSVPLPEAQPG